MTVHVSRSREICLNTCVGTPIWSSDGVCDDGGDGAEYAGCLLGTDCSDCGRRGGGSDVPHALIILPGARLQAVGSATAPITFTALDVTDLEASSPSDLASVQSMGLWLGLIVIGEAPVVRTEDLGLRLGAVSAAHRANSGALRYVRVWHAGAHAHTAAYNSRAAVTLAGVGNETVVEHVEAAFSASDGIRLIGGGVDVRYISAVANNGTGISVSHGYRGRGQFLFVMVSANASSGMIVESARSVRFEPFPTDTTDSPVRRRSRQCVPGLDCHQSNGAPPPPTCSALFSVDTCRSAIIVCLCAASARYRGRSLPIHIFHK